MQEKRQPVLRLPFSSGSSVVGLRMTMTLFPILLLVIGVIFFHKKYQLTEERLKEIQEA